MKRPKLVRDDSGEREGWWLGDRFVPDVPPEAREWYEARKLRALLSEAMVALHHVYVSSGKPDGMRPLIEKINGALLDRRAEPDSASSRSCDSSAPPISPLQSGGA